MNIHITVNIDLYNMPEINHQFLLAILRACVDAGSLLRYRQGFQGKKMFFKYTRKHVDHLDVGASRVAMHCSKCSCAFPSMLSELGGLMTNTLYDNAGVTTGTIDFINHSARPEHCKCVSSSGMYVISFHMVNTGCTPFDLNILVNLSMRLPRYQRNIWIGSVLASL